MIAHFGMLRLLSYSKCSVMSLVGYFETADLSHFWFSVFLNPGSTPLEWISNHGVNLDKCQGDCDNNSDCRSPLICYQRGNKDSNAIPGCTGDLLAIDEANNDPGTDYCYDPTAGSLCLLLCI